MPMILKAYIIHVFTFINITFPPLSFSPNDIVALSPNTFYFSNDAYGTSYVARNIERYLMLARGNVIYYDGKNMHKVVDKGFGCNGVAISPDKRYVAFGIKHKHCITNAY